MAIFEINNDKLIEIDTTFENERFYEKDDLQRLLAKQIEILSENILIISEEFCNWEDSKRRIDLLGIDSDGKIVVIELKRTVTGGHMELQALRYAAMVVSMNREQIIDTYDNYLKKNGNSEYDAEEEISKFVNEEAVLDIGSEVRIILISSEFSKEITSTVLWLNENGIDIKCFKLKPYKLNQKMILDIQQIIPLPEAEDYVIKIREKTEQQKQIKKSNRDSRQFDLIIGNLKKEKLAKRNLILQIVKEAIKRGKNPDEISDCINWRKIWFMIDGEYKLEKDFLAKAFLKNDRFDERRYFTKDSELILCPNKTYALSNQWGPRTIEAIDNILNYLKAPDIKYEVHNNQ